MPCTGVCGLRTALSARGIRWRGRRLDLALFLSLGVQGLTAKAARVPETRCCPQCRPFGTNITAVFSRCLNPPQGTAPPSYAASRATKSPGWREPQLRVGRFRFWHRRCPCAGPTTPDRALALDRVRSRRPSRSPVESPATIAASVPVGVATVDPPPAHAAATQAPSASARASRPSRR